MKKHIWIIGLLMIIGCAKKAETPKNMIGQKQMTEILTEMYLYQQNYYVKDYADKGIDLSEVDAQILVNHGVSAEDFKESHHYYVVHPEKFSQILDEVKKTLEDKLSDEEKQKREATKTKSAMN
ncbi:MAG: DUF4296 domain-containing protein [Weeksellaceae bacterium]|nr:DUF4296 domain-containing protein [Weeksellaceae bacterium]